jgi:hypothetical protein
MPMSEEERRRCILLGGCTQGATRESALAEEIDDILTTDGTPGAEAETIARGLIARGYIRGDHAAPAKGDERGKE